MIRRTCEVLSLRRSGAYHALTLVAPEIAESARPGQFVEIGVPAGRDFLLRRPFSIHRTSRRGGWAGTLEIIFDVVGPGTAWMGDLRPHETIDVIGPLGRSFRYPRSPEPCLLVGGGYGTAPLHFLADELRARSNRVAMIVGARDHDRVLKPVESKRLGSPVLIATEDGSTGERGLVTDFLPEMLERTGARAVYACGPNAMLREVAERCARAGVACQVAVEELMACGLGVCWTCAVPALARDGRGWWNVRACVEGPVFDARRVWWSRWLGPAEPRRGGPAPAVARATKTKAPAR